MPDSNIVKTFELILAALDQLCIYIDKNISAACISVSNNLKEFKNDKNVLFRGIKHFYAEAGLVSQETYSLPGAVGIDKNALQLLTAVNKTKEAFNAVCKPYYGPNKLDPTKPIRLALAVAGYKNIRLKQVYRHIFYINYHPDRIAWSKARNSSNIIVTKAEAMDKLLKEGKGKNIEIQLRLLGQIKSNELLVIKRDIRPYWIANISSQAGQHTRKSTAKIRASLPIFYLYNSGLSMTQVCFSKKSNRICTSRADRLLEDEPFLKSINAYKYCEKSKL